MQPFHVPFHVSGFFFFCEATKLPVSARALRQLVLVGSLLREEHQENPLPCGKLSGLVCPLGDWLKLARTVQSEAHIEKAETLALEPPGPLTMADKTVLDVFSKFDKDSSGSISREELGDVLKALQEEPWEDDEIDNLLTAADSSGDGELQIQEFVKWVFAEDKNISQGLKGKFKLKVSGCSRAEFNGDYTQQEGEFYYRRPVFHCAETNKYLYYHGERKQWQLYWRTGSKSSCRLKTTRAAHMAGEVQWAVWSGKKKAFVRESSMTCTPEATESAEAMLMNAEDCVKFDEIYFKKIDGVVGNRAVYRQSKGDDWGDTYVFFEELESRWKRGDEVKPGQPSLNVSRTLVQPSASKGI